MTRYGLADTELTVMQDGEVEVTAQFAALEQQEAMAMLYRRNQEADLERDRRLSELEEAIGPPGRRQVATASPAGLREEAAALFPALEGLRFAAMPPIDSGATGATLGVAYDGAMDRLGRSDRAQLMRWLARRTGVDSVLLVR